MMVRHRGLCFYVSLNYIGLLSQFVLFVFLATDKATANKYKVKLMLETSQEDGSKEQRLYEKTVVAIEEFTRYEDVPESQGIRLHQSDAKNFVQITKNTEDEDYTVHLPMEITEILFFDD